MWSNLDTYLFPLQAGTVCPSGTFELDVATGKMKWSDGMFGIHGLRPGEVVPTFELLMSHKHPQDREPILALWKNLLQSGGQGALLHRIIDVRGRERRVFSALQAVPAASGRVEQARGFMVDVTQSLRIESQQAATEAIEGAYAHKAVIEQAKGIIMALQGVEPPAAFEMLATCSQHANVKLHIVAEELVNAAVNGKAREVLTGF
ncbi:PAS and ANTAR domain-containing protein [Arthrobacter sp. NQ7]|uniref:PAS and ANTAR domain-containing protein n=1 Tax=Arthrobacter sp. NQ7 TaxID=3032303 RepID=UPI00240F8A99|nr:PAS and ANTAR domain-containing protein [Arthrobacter sp. NQ7]MDJ0455898.1 PAS and ANTAR domain-containing protein [Arthrobacter sp. NQ7]